MKCSFFFFLFSFCLVSYSQIKVSGKVVDDKTNLGLAFVDVFVPDSEYYTTTNTDGSFYLEVPNSVSSIKVSQFGYYVEDIDITQKANYDIVVRLSKEENEKQLKEVVITTRVNYKNKKENPAYAILREVWKRKKTNGLKKVDDYQYEEYEKIQFDLNNIDSAFTKKKIFNKLEFVFNNIDTSRVSGKAYLPMFLNESITEVIGRNRPNKKEIRELIANKTSGFQDNEIVSQSVKNLYKDYDIYENRINFFNKGFVSPIATDGFFHYDYELRDTIKADDVECYRIKYYPKREGELTFKGTFLVTKDTYAIKEITLATTKGINVNFIRDIYVELEYEQLNDSVFVPKETYTMLDMSLLTKKSKEKGIFAHRTVSFEDYKFDQHLPDSIYQQNVKYKEIEDYTKDDSYWELKRHIALKKSEKNIYETLERLENTPKFKRFVNLGEIIASGYWNVWNAIDIGRISSFIGVNSIEGWRLKIGARTYFSRNDTWRAKFYTAYGFKDEKVKYGAEFRKMFNPNNRFTLGIGTKRDIEQLGAQLTTDESILSRTFASSGLFQRGNNTSLSNVHQVSTYAEIELFKNTVARLDGTYQTIKTQSDDFNIDYVQDGKLKSVATDSRISLSLMMHPGAKYSLYGLDRYEHSTLAPTIMLKYTKGFKGIFNSGFDYNKLQLFYYHPILVATLGKLDFSLEAGKTFEPVPISLLSVIPGNQSLSIVPNVFSQINYYEFVTDTYSSMHLEHHFNGRLFGFIPLLKKLKLREVAFFRTAWGSISDKAKAMNRSSIQYIAPNDKLYYEYGFGIENIGIGNVRPLRIDFNWRGNYYDNPTTDKVSKFGVKFGFFVNF
ncbi:MAG: carboxypeptidase-like regulatory domain-containing protein [Flavobacteriales bacterium]|nr:carboxypeptidase-like regulatory domain-containing protein [Flavobacteriales bacterium]